MVAPIRRFLFLFLITGTEHSMEEYCFFLRILGHLARPYGSELRLRNVANAIADIHASDIALRHQICKSLFIPYRSRSI